MFGELKDYNYKDSTIQNKPVFIKTIDVWMPILLASNIKLAVGLMIINWFWNSVGKLKLIWINLFVIKQAFFLGKQVKILLLHRLNLTT